MGPVIGILLHASVALGAPERVAVLAPEGNPIVPRLQRNFTEQHIDVRTAVVPSCGRRLVAKLLADLQADTAVCTDGDVVSIWKNTTDSVQLIEAFPILAPDDRTAELTAARATIAATTSHGNQSMTIVANDSDDAAWIMANAHQLSLPSERETDSTPAVTPDRPAMAAPVPPPRRYAPSLVLSAGPAIYASKAGGIGAADIRATIGLGRRLALVPWVFIPSSKNENAIFGNAEFRPTLFGLGVETPLAPTANFIVPRLGAGYALLWMHTWPGIAINGASAGQSENLWAPCVYVTAALSFRLTSWFRLAAEGMLGTASSNLNMRIGGSQVASWGFPIASLAARAEFVIE